LIGEIPEIRRHDPTIDKCDVGIALITHRPVKVVKKWGLVFGVHFPSNVGKVNTCSNSEETGQFDTFFFSIVERKFKK